MTISISLLAACTALVTTSLMARGPQEVEVPRFHTEKAKASYVLALPPSHNQKKASPLILDFHGAIQPSRKGANVTYDRLWSSFVRKVPGVAHAFPSVEEYARCFAYLEQLAGDPGQIDHLGLAKEAMAREDWLLASSHLLKLESPASKRLLAKIESKGKALAKELKVLDPDKEFGQTYEGWWRLRTQFHRFPELGSQAQRELDRLDQFLDGRTRYRARRDWFRSRGKGEAPVQRAPKKKRGKKQPEAPKPANLWAFDQYLSYDQVTNRLKDLEKNYPSRVRLTSMGKSIEGRELWVVELTNRVIGKGKGRPEDKPAVFVQGGIHGNEASSVMTTLYFAYQLGANPKRRRSIDKLLRYMTLYVAPATNPDALQHYITEPSSYWRPRFNYRPNDADKDGRMDEDPYEDLNGDGEISQMYKPDPEGKFVLKDGHVVRGSGKERWSHVGREGIDNDGDGRYSEDPKGGVNLNRNFPVGFKPRRDFEGNRGEGPASEPETKAIVDFVRARPNINLFFDYHNAAGCVFYWLGEDAGSDQPLFEGIVGRADKLLGYKPRPLSHKGAGLSIAWAYGELGIPGFIVELEATRGPADRYFEEAWQGDVFVKAEPFEHPQLGRILIGNDYKKIPKRNPHPKDILWQAQRNWEWLRGELKALPRLRLEEASITHLGESFRVQGRLSVTSVDALRDRKVLPLDGARARGLQRSFPIVISAEGAELEEVLLEPPKPGEAKPFSVTLRKPEESVTLVLAHPRGGALRLAVRRPRSQTVAIRKDYEIIPGYLTPDEAIRANNAHYKNGVSEKEMGPAFKLRQQKSTLKVAVLLGEWKDKRHQVETEAFERVFFSNGGFNEISPTGQAVYGSLLDFYQEMSYGKMQVAGKIFDWVQLPGTYQEYSTASFGSPMLQQRLEAAVLKREGTEALDGYDGMVFIWAGNPVHRVSCLWPMRIKLKNRPKVIAFKTGELYQGQMGHVGIACHEMGHTFGVNDKYGMGAPVNPMGPWCLMCKGTHGYGNSGRHRPFHLCAWCKMVIGWVEPVVIDPSRAQKLALRPILYGPSECYRILLKPDGSEYLLLENRRREGFFTELPSPGLAILRVGPNTRPSAPQKQVQLMPAHGLPAAARSEVAKPEAVAWPQPGRTEFEAEGVHLSQIRLVDDVVYFRLERKD